MTENWWKNAVIYQIYPRSFKDSNGDGIGDLSGIIEKLDYLQLLGVDALWLSPIYKSPMVDNGYDVSDYQDIDPLFGTMTDFERLVSEAKKRQLKIIMDVVVNHSSNQHFWFQEAKKSRENPYREFYIWRNQPIGEVKNWTYEPVSQQYYYHLFNPQQPDLNWENPKLRQAIYQMMNFWVDKGVAGFRMDVIDLIGKKTDLGITVNGPELHHYLQEMHQAVFAGHDLLTVGEAWSSSPELAKLYSAPQRQELSMVFGFWHFLTSAGNGDKWQPLPLNVPKLKTALAAWQEISPEDDEGWNALFYNNHDLPRVVSFWGDTGEFREQSAKTLSIVLHLMRGTPFIYQGEELGMTNFSFTDLSMLNDVESLDFYAEKINEGYSNEEIMDTLRKMSRDNARTPMQWIPGEKAGFTTGKPWLPVNPNHTRINALTALSDKDSIFYTYQKLINLRHEADWVTWGSFELLDTAPEIISYLREFSGRRYLIVANLSSQEQIFTSKFTKKADLIATADFPDQLTHVKLATWSAFAVEIN